MWTTLIAVRGQRQVRLFVFVSLYCFLSYTYFNFLYDSKGIALQFKIVSIPADESIASKKGLLMDTISRPFL